MLTDPPTLDPPWPVILHNFFRSSTSHRVRIALNLKQVPYQYVAYHLRKGEQRQSAYLSLNPQGLVPTLQLADGSLLTQSLAIIEYLNEVMPEPGLLPRDPAGRARVRSLAQMIAIDTHPINNLRVLNELRIRFSANEKMISDWFCHWVAESFEALEKRLSTEPETGNFCHGDTPSIADICLAAQVASNARFAFPETPYPTIRRIAFACEKLPAFRDAAPASQPDSE
jgi:maleylpyruvate isomerase